MTQQDLASFIQKDTQKDILKFLTCGSVDDGKSTLIGCLLYQSALIKKDQMAEVQKEAQKRTGDATQVDYSLLLDGLKAEREQGITIDVAYRYFETPQRKFIIADCPGHEQYTKNMVTGASHCDLGIVLIDGQNKVTRQTRRHALLFDLLGIKDIIVCINKMDLVAYQEEVFQECKNTFLELSKTLHFENITFIPVSAITGENVTRLSENMPFYQGQTLIETLNTYPISKSEQKGTFLFNVYRAIRPNALFRGFAGSVKSGSIMPGDEIMALPSFKTAHVKEIFLGSKQLSQAVAGQSVTLTLQEEIDISEGDIITQPDYANKGTHLFEAWLIHLDDTPLQVGKTYLLHNHNCFTRAIVQNILEIKPIDNCDTKADNNTQQAPLTLHQNEIAKVQILASRLLFMENYYQNKEQGGFILVDRQTNVTSSVGLYLNAQKSSAVQTDTFIHSEMTQEDRPYVTKKTCPVLLIGQQALDLAPQVEKELLKQGYAVYFFAGSHNPSERVLQRQTLIQVSKSLTDNGITLLSAINSLGDQDEDVISQTNPHVIELTAQHNLDSLIEQIKTLI